MILWSIFGLHLATPTAQRRRVAVHLATLLLSLSLLFIPSDILAAPHIQSADPATQCAEGIEHFLNRNYADAISLLESGFTNRADGTFATASDLGNCALILGFIYNTVGEQTAALDVYAVALEAYQQDHNQEYEALTLRSIGDVYDGQGSYDEALGYFEQALVIQREIADRSGEAGTLTKIGSLYSSQGRLAEALDYFQNALELARGLGDRDTEGSILNNIGGVFHKQAMYAQALEMYEEAIAIAREEGDRVSEGETLNNIGVTYRAQGRYAEALESYQLALEIMKEQDDQGGIGTTLNNIGLVYHFQGRYSDAIYSYQKALAISKQLGDRALEAKTLNNFGSTFSSQGRYALALDYLGQSLTIKREIGDRSGEGTTLNNIGGVYLFEGRYAEALDHFQQSLVIKRQVGDRAGEGRTLNNIGEVYKFQGRQEEAIDYFLQAQAIQQEIGDMAGMSGTLNNLGSLLDDGGFSNEALEFFDLALEALRQIGDRAGEETTLMNIGTLHLKEARPDKALEYLEQALVITQEIGDRSGEGAALHNLGSVYHSLRQYEKALDYFQRALLIRQEVGDQHGEAGTLNNMGFLYQDMGKYSEALERYEQAMSKFESVRATSGNDSARAAYIAQFAHLYDRTVDLYLKLGLDEKAFLTTERGRTRAFLDSLATGYVELADDAAATLYAREQETYASQQAALDALTMAKANYASDTELIKDLETQFALAEQEHQAVLEGIAARGDELSELIPGRSSVIELAEARELIDDETTVVSFWVQAEQTLVFVLTGSTMNVVSLPIGAEELEDVIQDFRSFSNTNAAYPGSAITLYKMLIEPLKPYLKTQHLAIVPHGALHYLPFAALTDGDHYFIDDYTISYLPSMTAWQYIQPKINKDESIPLVLGNPTTDDDDLKPLPYAERESIAIATLFGVMPLLRQDATESAVRVRSEDVGMLHLAAHGAYNAANPLYSTVYLAPDGQNDGHLETHEIYALSLENNDLVVLSACETQMGALSQGDEVVGMTRAFFYAGSPTVVASLWAVDDRATEMLMEKFYDALNSGVAKAEALRQAQMYVRIDYPNPYYWAAFVLNGDPGKLPD